MATAAVLRKQTTTNDSLPNLCFLAKASMEAVGSEPIDKKQIIGVLMSLSSHMLSKFRITPSAYCQNKREKITLRLTPFYQDQTFLQMKTI